MNEPTKRSKSGARATRAVRESLFAQAPAGSGDRAPPRGDEIVQALEELRNFADALAAGDLSRDLPIRGPVAGSLKALQASLRHVTWQTQAVAQGDLTQRVHFMGEFANAFNSMVERLGVTMNELKQANTALAREVAEHRAASDELQETRKRYLLVADHATDIIFSTDLQGRYTYLSPSAERIFGIPLEQLLNSHMGDQLKPEATDLIRAGVKRLIDEAGRTPVTQMTVADPLEVEVLRRDGPPLWMEVLVSIARDEMGLPSQVVGVARDIDARKAAEAAERRQRLLADALQEAGRTFASKLELEDVVEALVEEVCRRLNNDFAALLLVENRVATVARIRVATGSGGARSTFERRSFPIDPATAPDLVTLLDSRRPLAGGVPSFARVLPEAAGVQSWVGAPILAGDRVLGLVCVGSLEPDVFRQGHADFLFALAGQGALALRNAQLYGTVKRLAITDSLTGLYNRRHFMNVAGAEFERARRYGRPLAVLLVDIDHFKAVNDTYGHLIGDATLRTVTAAMRRSLRRVDLLGRFGGEEFVALLPETGGQGARIVAERIRSLVEATPTETERGPIRVTVSLGLGSFEPPTPSQPTTDTVEALVDRADQAMYESKRLGRNRASLFAARPGGQN